VRLVAIGGSDAGISAALRAREVDPDAEVTVVVAELFDLRHPVLRVGEVGDWRNLAHRTLADLKATGMKLRLKTVARQIDANTHRVLLTPPDGGEQSLPYDRLLIATGARPVRPPIHGLGELGPSDGVHLLHSMSDTFALMRTLEQPHVRRVVIVGARYIGLEMAEALTTRGMVVTQLEQLPEVLPTVDPELGAVVRAELEHHGVTVSCSTRVDAITAAPADSPARLEAQATGPAGQALRFPADAVLVVVGVRPDSELAAAAGAALGVKQAIDVDREMRTSLPDVFAAGDCAVTHHRLLGSNYLPLGTSP
jgi:NADPH-dependent 2,4-dienoyl-CoA reductase/sulfur reductase-like enzyme